MQPGNNMSDAKIHLKHCCVEVNTPPARDCLMLMKYSEKHIHQQAFAAAHAPVDVQACDSKGMVKPIWECCLRRVLWLL